MRLFFLLYAGWALALMAEPTVLESPSSRVVITLEVAGGRALYSVSIGGREAIQRSALGLVLEGAARLDSNFRAGKVTRSEHRGSWKPVYGERAEFPDRWNGMVVELREEIPPRRTLELEFRAHDEGAAFRYRLPEQAGISQFTIGEEATEFVLPPGSFGWETPIAQAVYRRLPVERITRPSERPLLVELPGGIWAALAEAGVEDFASMFLVSPRPERHALVAKLMGPAQCRTPFAGPWRVILLGDTPGELLEHNYLLQNLSPPARLQSTDWIRPGKVLREVTLSTRGGREAADFAARHGIQYIEYDTGWYGYENDEQSDATRVAVDPRRLRREPEYQGLDVRQVVEYARSKGVGVLLYVNRRAVERQLETILPLYAQWGVAGVKYGFVNVHTQSWTRWLYGAVAQAAAHRLVVDIHDEFRPTGMSRTWPNLLTQEGILGNEGFPDAAHSTVLPFTRFLAGAADYTLCWLDPRLKNTWGHQMALSVVFYSPLQFVYWYDRPVSFTSESAGMEWFREVPTTWDDTRVLDGRPGEFAAIARRRGTRWFLGAITNGEEREVRLRLDMLADRGPYRAVLYADGDGPRDVRRSERTVRRGDVLELKLQARGGPAVRFTPADR
jgi:alpha-glucosidase